MAAHPAVLFNTLQRRRFDATPFLRVTATRVEMTPRRRAPGIGHFALQDHALERCDKRQREAVASFARRAGYELVGEYYDKAARGADALEAQSGFRAMLECIAGNGVHMIASSSRRRTALPAISSCRKPGIACCGTRALRSSRPTAHQPS